MLKWIAASAAKQVAREDIRRHALGNTRSADETQGVVDALIRGWLAAQAAAGVRCAGPPGDQVASEPTTPTAEGGLDPHGYYFTILRHFRHFRAGHPGGDYLWRVVL